MAVTVLPLIDDGTAIAPEVDSGMAGSLVPLYIVASFPETVYVHLIPVEGSVQVSATAGRVALAATAAVINANSFFMVVVPFVVTWLNVRRDENDEKESEGLTP